jgi:SHS2 domain-containing protein
VSTYKYIKHTADLGIEVWGKNFEELLINIAHAMFETEIAGQVMPRCTMSFTLSSGSREDLFIEWCRELIYRFSVAKFIPCKYEISLKKNHLIARLKGETFDPKNHRIKLEIKNPTYHGFTLRQTSRGLRATIIFDV